MEAVTGFLFLGSKITADCNCSHKIRRQLFLGREAMTNLDCVKTKDITLPTKVCKVKAMVFPVVMYRCESWTIKKAEHRRIDAFKLWFWRRLLRESPLESKEIKPVSLKENQLWILFARTYAEGEAPILWPPDTNIWLIGKVSDPGKDWRQKEKKVIEDEMFGWHYRFYGHQLGQTLGDGEG